MQIGFYVFLEINYFIQSIKKEAIESVKWSNLQEFRLQILKPDFTQTTVIGLATVKSKFYFHFTAGINPVHYSSSLCMISKSWIIAS